jgi:hypothetical protein
MPAVAAISDLGARVDTAPRPSGVAPEDVAVDEPHAASPPADPVDTAVPDARRDLFVLVAAALVLVPSLVAAVSALRHPYIPTNDWALIELQVRQVGTGDTPLVGVWSRFGWRHPGPLLFYALALPYRLVPDDRGLLFATACVNLAATVGFALVVIRYPRTRALIALFGMAMLQRGLGIDQLGDPWNPTILIVPFALYLVLCVEIAVGRDRWPLAVAAGVASFVVQAHVGLLQPVVLVGVVALGLRWLRTRPRRIAWRSLVPTAVVLGLAWLPPVIDQVDGSGNLGLLFRWARGDDIGGGMGVLTEGRLSHQRILDGAAWLLDPTGMWVGRFQPVDVFGSLLLGRGRPLTLLWVPIVLGLVLALVRRAPLRDGYRRPTIAVGVLAATAVVALFTDLSTAQGAPVFWPFRWVVAVVMLLWIALGWAVAGALVHRFPWLDEPWSPRGTRSVRSARPTRPVLSARSVRSARVRLAGVAMVAAVALPVGLAAWRGPVGRQPLQPASDALLRLQPAILEHARQEPLVVANTVDKLNDKDLALPVILERAGIEWAEADDPRAPGHNRYLVLPAGGLGNPQVAGALAVGNAELLARSGPPRPGEPPDSELVLVRTVQPAVPDPL